jgi:hypothetical protein
LSVVMQQGEPGRNRRLARSAVPSSGVFLCGVASLLMLIATPAWSARIVDIRMGQHPDFSRVVFELDSPVGYKVERRSPSAGGSELIVSLNASAQARTLRRKLKFIESVEVRSRAGRSTVYVRLRGDGLKLKEMILANPPRIVLDVLAGKATAARPVARAKVEKRSKPATSKPKPADTKTQTARAKPPAPKPAAVKPPVTKTSVQPVVPVAEPAEPKARPRPKSETSTAQSAQPPASMSPSGADVPSADPQRLAMARPPAPPIGPADSAKASMPVARASAAELLRHAPKPAARARPQPVPSEPAAVVAPAGGGLFGMSNITLAGAGVLFVVLLGAAFMFVRRRNEAQIVDASAFGNPLGEDDPIIDAPPVSDTSPAEEGVEMESVSEDTSTLMNSAPGGAPMGAQAAALGGADVARLVGDFERRVAAMEARIDELVEAKERLERQVAAQTEELRVQRAAIARTQRAVRNMSRPIDDSATEPAERDPSRPEGPRG